MAHDAGKLMNGREKTVRQFLPMSRGCKRSRGGKNGDESKDASPVVHMMVRVRSRIWSHKEIKSDAEVEVDQERDCG